MSLRTAATMLMLVSSVGTIQAGAAAYPGYSTSSGYGGSYRYGGSTKFFDPSSKYLGKQWK